MADQEGGGRAGGRPRRPQRAAGSGSARDGAGRGARPQSRSRGEPRRDARGESRGGARRDAQATWQPSRPLQAPRAPRPPDPQVPEEVTGAELDREVRRELAGLGTRTATEVARHLVMAGRLLEVDPEAALAHAEAARRRAGRIGVVREAAGIAAYRAGRYAEALRELRTARRLTGSQLQLPVMADCERGLGRPERALDLAASPEAATLDAAGRVELLIVAAGARLDLGDVDAALATLDVAGLHRPGRTVLRDRLRAAYATALDAAGRHEEAASWRQRAGGAGGTGEGGEPAGGVDGLTPAGWGSPHEVGEIIDLLEED
jgi:hypothetical protein